MGAWNWMVKPQFVKSFRSAFLMISKDCCCRHFSLHYGYVLYSFIIGLVLLFSNHMRYVFLTWRNSPSGPRPPHYRMFMITLRHTTLGRTPLGEWSARRRDLYLTTHNTHKRQTSMLLAGFEPAIPASERSQTHALHRAATGSACVM